MNPHRDSYGPALARLDDDMPRVAALLGPYSLSEDELELVVALLNLVGLDELAGAGRA